MKTMGKTDMQKGFTIVELLVVIIVIAILAAITVVAYNGISKRAVESTMQEDLHTAASVLGKDNITNGSYPATLAAANGGLGVTGSGSNQLTYVNSGTDFCVSVTNSKTSNVYRVKASTGTIEQGTCGATISTYAGTSYGYTEGNALTTAQFKGPHGVIFDSSGNMFVTDDYNGVVRKITPGGTVSTFATGFNRPDGITIDTSNNLYVSDRLNGLVKKITPAGVVSTFATVSLCNGITIDSSGNLFVAENSGNTIKKITPAGVVSTFATGFNNPTGVAFDASGNLYVADMYNYKIKKITPGGTVSVIAGSTQGISDGAALSAQFNAPGGVAVDASGNVYISEMNVSNRIRKLDSSYTTVTTIAGSSTGAFADGVGTAALFYTPDYMTFDGSGNLYIADYSNNKIRKLVP